MTSLLDDDEGAVAGQITCRKCGHRFVPPPAIAGGFLAAAVDPEQDQVVRCPECNEPV
jgi:DNA-directed RNA polymerase subunit RPC12/RpoP